MTPLTADDFTAFFSAVHSAPGQLVEPFAWQTALCRRVLSGSWPSCVEVPTGMGKTAIVDIAVFALASQADLAPEERTAPTRTFIVVDRRVIVDQTYVRAQKLRDRLLSAGNGIVRRVAEALRSLNSQTRSSSPLDVVRMRGGTTWSWRWLASPTQPAVITGTVDQLGSRLLFRGYGVGEHLRPIDAALTGNDSIIILDEAHLSQPFVDTVLACHASEVRCAHPILPLRRPRPVLLSATPPTGHAAPTDTFRLDMAAETSPEAVQRLAAHRHVHLHQLAASKPAHARSDLADALAALAAARCANGARRVAVVCNTVDLARAVHRRLEASGLQPGLLIGRCRPVDREQLDQRWLTRLNPDHLPENDDLTLVVATQTIEVGADLDVDALITEACPLDALLQRLGRLDRRGRRHHSHADLVHHPSLHGTDAAVYGDAIDRTWRWLCDHARNPKAGSTADLTADLASPSVDLGPRALSMILHRADRRACATRPPATPVILEPILDSWARTSPAPEPDQPVAPFLHGIGGHADIPVCWRDGLPTPTQETLPDWRDELRSAPPAPGEIVDVPVGQVRAFLAGRPNRSGADLEGQAADSRVEPDTPATRYCVSTPAIIIRPDGTVVVAETGEIRPGATLVLPASSGGHDEWGWTGTPGPAVADVADLAASRPRLRARQAILDALLGDTAPQVPPPPSDEQTDDLASWLDELAGAARAADNRHAWYGQQLALIADQLAGRPTLWTGRTSHWRLLRQRHAGLSDSVGDDSTGASSGGATHPVQLDRHLHDVQTEARQTARQLGLASHLIDAVSCAALFHDAGKADRRFQVMLHRGNKLSQEASGGVLAKSAMDPADRSAFTESRTRAGWPPGMRHEAISAALLEQYFAAHPDRSADLDLDLVRHLVASHHGRSRPLLPPLTDPHPVQVDLTVDGFDLRTSSDALLIDWDSPRRFAQLQLHYGRWGLALLESIVRLADQTCSHDYATPTRASNA